MKCEQHGVEMEWRGSLAAGRMYCEHCASTGGRSYADIAKELLSGEAGRIFGMDMAAPGTTDKTASEIYRDALANSKPRRMKAPTTPGAPDPYVARDRMRQAEKMMDVVQRGGVHPCPYCGLVVDKKHLGNEGRHCEQAYHEDEAIASGRRA